MTLPLSACVLTRNESRQLADCLAALAWVDEIVVVDDESTDETVALARRFTTRVFVRAKNEDFAAQRNFALDQAGGGWVLFVDADERVTPELATEIRAATAAGRHDAYALRRRDIQFGRILRHGESERTRLLRLARRGAGRWRGRVHETWEVAGSRGTLRHPLLHRSHEDVAHFLRKLDYYSTLGARRLSEEDRDGGVWQLALYPLASFFRNYVMRQGFRDGSAGFVLAVLMACHPFLARAKALERRMASEA